MAKPEIDLIIRPLELYIADLTVLVDGDFPTVEEMLQRDPPSYLFQGNEEPHLEDHGAHTVYWIKIFKNIAKTKQGVVFSPMEERAVENAGALHDIGRNGNKEDEDHGGKSAILAGDYLKGKVSDEEILLTQEIIKSHEPRVQVGIFLRSDLIFLIKEADKTQFPRTGDIFDIGRVTYHQTLDPILPVAQGLRIEAMRNITQGMPRYQSVVKAGETLKIMR